LLTTPVVYILLDKLRRRSPSERMLGRSGGPPPGIQPLPE
jgi:multidrug efflux pump